MKNIEQLISPLIESQFPSFYETDGPDFITFVKAYYEWLDSGGSESRKILSYRDIDSTVNNFIQSFRNEYLSGIPSIAQSDTTILVKHVQDIYKAKGSSEAFKLFFRLVYGEQINTYVPNKDILKASDGIWTIPQYIECSVSDRAYTFIGKQITGSISGATAFVENINRRKIAERFIDVVYLSEINGNFITGEYIIDDHKLTLTGCPFITGSLNTIVITNGGANNNIGDLFNVTSQYGSQGLAIVTSTQNGTGRVAFTLQDGGYGFETNSDIIVSNGVFSITAANGNFTPFMSAIQPLEQVYYHANLNIFSNQQTVFGYSGNTQVATGFVVSTVAGNTSVSNSCIISPTSGNWSQANNIQLSSNSSVNTTAYSPLNVTATATVVGSNATHIGLSNTNGTLYSYGTLLIQVGVPLGLATGNTTTQNVVGTNTYFAASFAASPGDILYFRANNGIIGTVNTVTNNTLLTLTSNSLYAFSNTTVWHTTTVSTVNTGIYYNSGSGATFNIGSLKNTESVKTQPDRLIDNNTGLIPFLDIFVDGHNSNLVSNAYGCSGNAAIGYNNGVIYDALTTNTITIGTIQYISAQNPGSNYNADPFIAVYDRYTGSYGKYDFNIKLSNTNSFFANGDTLYQNVVVNSTILTLSSNTGAFKSYEGVYQIQNTSSNVAGIVVAQSTNTITIQAVNGSFNTSNSVVGKSSNASGTISTTTPQSTNVLARGLILAVSGNTLTVRRTSFNYDFSTGSTVYSQNINGANTGLGTIGTIVINSSNDGYMGFNSTVNAVVKTASGIATTMQIISSGFGYLPNDSLTLISSNSAINDIFGVANVATQGSGQGFWENNQGKLNSDKYIHDNKYYQEFSYEIQSRLSFDKYADVLKKILHISGNELFGKTVIQTEEDITLYTPGVEVSNGSAIIRGT
jgi:hypothetical protein